jgi:hypothetical protein
MNKYIHIQKRFRLQGRKEDIKDKYNEMQRKKAQ